MTGHSLWNSSLNKKSSCLLGDAMGWLSKILSLSKTSVLLLLVVFAFVCSSWGQTTGELFRVAAVNCGAFRYGAERATPEEFAGEWKRFAQDRNYDAILYSDVGKGDKLPGDIAIDRFDIRAAAIRRPDSVSEVRLPFIIENEDGTGKTRRFRALRLVYSLGERTLAVYGVHLVAEGHIRLPRKAGIPSPSQQLRRHQFEALIADAKRFDYAILTGDFNAQKAWEYDVFAKAGYKLGNCSAEFGTAATLRNIPADNVIISPGLSFVDFSVLKDYTLDTDHFPVAATVRLPPKTENSTNSIPSVAEFLEKSTAERRALFKNRKFRKAMFDAGYPEGEGLLSRWANVEKIPNLRDVGGFTNRHGRLLRRGVFYRSAGWNDNAKTPKDRSKSEWTKGESRLTEAGRRKAVESLGLRTDIDLRSASECWGMTESPLGSEVAWKHVSFGQYDEIPGNKRFEDAVKHVFAILSDPEKRPLVFHCIGGADRTGTLAFYIQALCDVDDDTLVKDWELTGCYTARSSLVHEDCIDRLQDSLLRYPGSNTKERVRSFLRSCGVSDAAMDAVRSALLRKECK